MNLKNLRREPLGDLVRRKLQYSAFRQKWNIGVTRHSGAVVAGLTGTRRQQQALDELQWMTERGDAFAADPFITRRAGVHDGYIIFYEYYPWRRQLGSIECVPFDKDGFGMPRSALDSPFHLSYPFVLVHEGRPLVLPEHSAAKRVSLYDFDGDGALTAEHQISDKLSLVDATIVHHQEKYWIFATHAGPADNRDLYIYFTSDLTDRWSPHAQNPVKSDISNARPAGQFISHAGKLFRPAQDCGSHYGSGIIINEIGKLTEEEYEETAVSEVRPVAGSLYEYGLHTISSADDYTVIDGARLESVIHPALDRLGRLVLPQRPKR